MMIVNAKLLALAAAAGLLIGSTAIGYAQTRGTSPGASGASPGHEMQQKGSVPGSPGASGYAPGHEMQKKGSKAGEPGASGFAPGRQGTSGRSNTRTPDTDRDRR